ncbi:MAG: DMT family transporter [Hyphomonadaceae bacterium]|nr:DMT family transporter [Hyphomonadaceae bacterium]
MNASPVAFYAALALAAGAFIPAMAAMSGAMGRTLGSSATASVIVVGGAFLMVLAYAGLNGGLKLGGIGQITLAQALSGFAMAFYVSSITFLGPRFGVGNAVMLVVAAQIASSAAIDHFGLFGAVQKPIDALRAAGLAIMVVGVVIAQVAASNAKPAP